jgi:protoporphyrinogen oxidase
MEKSYWLNLPAETADKAESEFPFLALVEHTNYIDKKHYGDDHILYCGDYVTPDHRYFDMEKEELVQLFAGQLHKFNPDFQVDWIRKSWLFRAKYAQPVPELNHSKNIPTIETPVRNLFFASMSQVYPWDRGTNFAVEIGRLAAEKMLMQVSKKQEARGK